MSRTRKQVTDLWDGFTTFPRLLRAFRRSALAKHNREAVLRFKASLEKNLLEIRDELRSGEYRWGAYRSFWVMDPKLRLIESAPFRDRVVHHALYEVMNPIFEPSFYAHSYACRPGLGTHRAMERLRAWVGAHPDFFCLQMDVSKYFPSIDRQILSNRIQERVADDRFLKLVQSLIFEAPGSGGIPIGNLTSQLFANLYLDRLDQFIKRELKVGFYVRYMDDIVLLDPNRARLIDWRTQIEEFGERVLKLRFHPHKTSLGPVGEGVSFVGFRIKPWGVWVKGKSLRRFRKRLRHRLPLEQKVRRLISYQGHIRHATNGQTLIRQFGEIAFREEAFMKS